MKTILTIFCSVIFWNAFSFPFDQNPDSITVTIDWKGLKTITGDDGISIHTFDVVSAHYGAEFNYLPVMIIEGIEGKISAPEIISWKGDTLTKNEIQVITNLELNNKQIEYRTLNFQKGISSSILLNPFLFDSLTNKCYKITEAVISFRQSETEILSNNQNSNFRTSQNVLASNEFFKIGVIQNGIYKIDKDYLNQLGIDAERINPRKIKIYGNGGGMLSQRNDAFRHVDLFENAIEVVGENDGEFDDGDFILFYGQSQHKLWLNEDDEIQYSHNIYADTTYYFLTVDGEDGKRVAEFESIQGDFPVINFYNDLQVHEVNEVNILNSGREWFGERFDATLNRNFNFNTRGIVPNSEVRIVASVMGQSLEPTSMDINYNSENLGSINFAAIPDGSYFTKGILETESFTTIQNAEVQNEAVVNLKFNQVSGVRSTAYLNYIIFECKKTLELDQETLIFRSTASLENPTTTFSIENLTGNHRIWNITNPLEPVTQKYQINSSIGSFGVDTDSLLEFVVFDPASMDSPISFGLIENQNIKGQATPDLLIVSHPLFYHQAQRLAQHRSSLNNLDVLIVTPQQVYNEFSSGSQDITAIRDMVRYFYLKGNQTKLKNLLLFGRTSYDYKDRVNNNTNFVPTYSSRNSYHPVYTYSSDDYYGFMEDNEGEWQESYSGDHTLDIGVGRLPVKTAKEAKTVVDKLINYDKNPETLDEWKNKVFFIADDGDGNTHQRDADNLATYIDTTYTRFNVNKIYVDSYEQIISAQGETAPEVNSTIDNSIDEGGIIFNFTGHGSEIRWCSETILDIKMINEWENFNRLPLFVTATCEFGRHDEPIIISGGEQLLLNPKGGAIGLVTTSRPVFSNTNYDINYAFYQSVFEKENNEYQDLGTIFKKTKNSSLRGSNNRNFCLLGDPSMKLAFAKNNIQISAVPDGNTHVPGDTIGALETIKLKGNIIENGIEVPTFDGILTATVFDKQKSIKTLGTESTPFNYKVRNSIIFKGDVKVENGEFVLEFVVPKNISYLIEKGKISLYAKSEQSNLDAAGSDVSFLIGGSSEYYSDDMQPDIELFINDTTFQEPGISGSDIIALAKISDDNGINILNDDLNEGVILSLDNQGFKYVGDFFKSELNTYKSGWLRYPISDLDEGYHQIVVGAYDTHNNYSEREIEFYVANSDEFYAEKLMNYPNPFRDYTTFAFEHNRSGEDLELLLHIFDAKGQLVFTGKQEINTSPGRINDLVWNGRGNSGKKLEAGLYVYTIKVRSKKDNSNYFLNSKLLIIN